MIALKEHLRKFEKGVFVLKLCPNIRMLMASTEVKPDRLTVARMRCKQWTCPVCSVRNLNAWRVHLSKTLTKRFSGVLWAFVTITAPGHLHGEPEATVTRLQVVWKRFYDILRRWAGRKVSYVYMYEAHGSGAYHIHALMDIGAIYDKWPVIYVWADPRRHHPMQIWLEDTLTSIGGGWVCDIRRVYTLNGGSAAMAAVAYAISYMAKSGSWVKFKKHARRIGVTRDIGGLPKLPKTGLTWFPVRELSIDDLISHGTIEDVSMRRKVLSGHFEHGYYPPLDPDHRGNKE